MIKLYIRNYFLLVIVLGVIIVSVYVFVLSLNQGVVNKNAQVMTDGTFNYLEESLKKIPKNQWQNYIDQLQKNNLVQKIQIVSYKNLPQQIKDNPALKKGQTASYQPLNLLSADNIYQGHSAYRRINKSKYYLKIEMVPPVIFQYQYNTQWMKITIDQLFAQKKFEDYEKIAQKATEYFGVPVIVSKFSNLTEEEQKNLLKWHVLAISYDDSHIATLRFLLPDKNYIATVGALRNSLLAQHMQYVLLSLCLVVLLFVSFFWSYPFYKSLNRLQKQAIKIGEGKFDEKIKLSKTSALMPLNHALNQMADQLQLLIYSHKSLTNAIAHEIKTPLARMRFALELLKAETKSEIIDDLDYDIEDLDQLINTLLLNAKLDRKELVLQKEKVNLSEMLSTGMIQYKKRYPKKKWQAEIEDNIYLLMDQKMFNRGINNLLINAYNYSKAIIKLSLKKENNLIILSISDDGLGIDEKNYQRIFEPFERVDQARSNHQVKGHGLGLAITKKIVEAHLGEIEVTRSKLGGAKFVIYLKDDVSNQKH